MFFSRIPSLVFCSSKTCNRGSWISESEGRTSLLNRITSAAVLRSTETRSPSISGLPANSSMEVRIFRSKSAWISCSSCSYRSSVQSHPAWRSSSAVRCPSGEAIWADRISVSGASGLSDSRNSETVSCPSGSSSKLGSSSFCGSASSSASNSSSPSPGSKAMLSPCEPSSIPAGGPSRMHFLAWR